MHDKRYRLAFKGMDVFARDGGNLQAQIWIAGRYMESISFLAAPYFAGRKLRTTPAFIRIL